jgi:hypothetical protein
MKALPMPQFAGIAATQNDFDSHIHIYPICQYPDLVLLPNRGNFRYEIKKKQ